ncbi:hypothetical protein [Hymenobacter arizonensis]|uniref:Glycosyl-4,4'-diaponeurosporenoate acyltransferase n=1 Tax=Hymenobacter arizonensis TaxID=1227077 RepID=A0A1I5XUC4_HYMAR|nr:hypothetical protein [Hymenobacter arizonensis]SFQ35579.1 hypothetical protein SAMN04515668_2049 [Hymenobacter arizonensis]
MLPAQKNTAVPSRALLAVANAIPSVLWSGLALAPIGIYCYQFMARPWLYGFLAISLLAYAVPTSWFGYWQLSRRPAMYRKLGVALVNRVTQNGDLVRRLIRRRYPAYRHVASRAALAALVRTTYHQERFHLVLFLFFGLTSLHAVAHEQVGWCALLLLTNVAYNVYPMWLQQYLRVRVTPKAP